MSKKSPTIKEIVSARSAEYLAAKSAADLKALFQRDGLATQQRWGKAVQAVVDLGGLDYYAARGQDRAASIDALRALVTHEVELYADAKARCRRFAMTDAHGDPVWYGLFFEEDQDFSFGDRDEQSACECAAARKAVYLASKVKQAVGARAVRLTLHVDAQWLTTLAGKASILASDARRLNIDLVMDWVPGRSNPADRWTTESGYKRPDAVPLQLLATPIQTEEVA